MKYAALATDYDGTIAHDGVVDGPTIAALERARAAGLRLFLVTGRELPDLFATFPKWNLFEAIVAENGALLYFPETEKVELLSTSPPPELVERLRGAGVPLSIGRTIVATVEPHEDAVLQAIHDLGLEWHIIFNKGAVMALPADINKATGLKALLKLLELNCEQVVGVGDAENDLTFLAACGFSVAVANALPSVKAAAKQVTRGARGAGVTEVIDELVESRR